MNDNMICLYTIISVSFLFSTLAVCSFANHVNDSFKPILILIIVWVINAIILTVLDYIGLIEMKHFFIL